MLRIRLEVPIRTKRCGILGLVIFSVLLIGGLVGNTQSVSAHDSSVSVNGTKTSITKGVRTKTAYRKRRTGMKVTKSSVKRKTTSTKKVVALPTEVAPSDLSADIAKRATYLVGSHYIWGGVSPKTGFDCTGLVTYVYGDKAKGLPRSATSMYKSVSKSSTIRPGDIVFFGRGKATHAAIYIGNGRLVHASTPKSGVRYDSLATIARALGIMGVGRIV